VHQITPRIYQRGPCLPFDRRQKIKSRRESRLKFSRYAGACLLCAGSYRCLTGSMIRMNIQQQPEISRASDVSPVATAKESSRRCLQTTDCSQLPHEMRPDFPSPLPPPRAIPREKRDATLSLSHIRDVTLSTRRNQGGMFVPPSY
jgi:hypothetical protein